MKNTGTTTAIVLAMLLNIALYSYIRVHYGANDWILLGSAIVLGLLGCFFGRRYDKVKDSAGIDTLTEVYNRKYVKDHFSEWMQLSDRKGQKLSVFIVDVDHFKTINDIHGHVMGDKVLLDIAKVLTLTVRMSDLVVRWGGDEFLVIMPCSCSNLSEAERIQQQFTKELHQMLGGLPVQVSASVGYAVYPDEGSNLSELLIIADKWLYKQKTSKKGPLSKV
jgi:diguanylate cyclase (GGDEF)-like protein